MFDGQTLLYFTGTLLTIRGRMFTDQIMETEDFDPNMPTIERYTTGSFWNQVICSFQFPPTKCFRRIDNRFCATLEFLTAATLSIEHYPHLKKLSIVKY